MIFIQYFQVLTIMFWLSCLMIDILLILSAKENNETLLRIMLVSGVQIILNILSFVIQV